MRMLAERESITKNPQLKTLLDDNIFHDVSIIDGINHTKKVLHNIDKKDVVDGIKNIVAHWPYKKIVLTVNENTKEKKLVIELLPVPGSA